MAAIVMLSASACRAAPAASATPSEQPAATPAITSHATPSASASTSPAPPTAPPPGEVGALLPSALGGARMEIRGVEVDGAIEPIWDRAIAERMARQLGVETSALQVALASPSVEDVAELPPGWRILAVTYPGRDPVAAVGGYLAERMLRPGTVTTLNYWSEGDRRNLLVGDAWSLGWTDEAVFVIDFDTEPYLSASPEQAAELPDAYDALNLTAEAILPVLPDPTPLPRPSYAPTDDTEPSAEPDPSMEALMPRSAGETPLTIGSFSYLREQDLNGFAGGLHSLLRRQFDRPARDLGLAVAAAEDSSFSVWAHRIDGVSADLLLGAFLGEMFAGVLGGGGGTAFRGEEVDGRRYVIQPNWALYAQGDILYWLQYFDFGDCFSDCETPPRPPLEEIARDAIAEIPEP